MTQNDDEAIDIVGSAIRGSGITECVIASCLRSPCVNGGTCMPRGSGFFCSCPLRFGGQTCAARKLVYILYICDIVVVLRKTTATTSTTTATIISSLFCSHMQLSVCLCLTSVAMPAS